MQFKPFVILSFLFFFTTTLIFGQETLSEPEDTHFKKNSFKIGLPIIAYERVFSSKRSLNLQFFYGRLSTDPPERFLSLDDVPEKDQNFVSAFIFNGEYRFYLSKKHNQPKGIYLAPFIRHARASFNIVDNSLEDDRRDDIFALAEIDLNSIGVGGQFGIQFQVGKSFVIDWGIIGTGASLMNFKFNILSDEEDVNWEQVVIIQNEQIQDELQTEEFGYIDRKFTENIEFEKDGNTAISNNSFLLPILRSSLTIGFKF